MPVDSVDSVGTSSNEIYPDEIKSEDTSPKLSLKNIIFIVKVLEAQKLEKACVLDQHSIKEGAPSHEKATNFLGKIEEITAVLDQLGVVFATAGLSVKFPNREDAVSTGVNTEKINKLNALLLEIDAHVESMTEEQKEAFTFWVDGVVAIPVEFSSEEVSSIKKDLAEKKQVLLKDPVYYKANQEVMNLLKNPEVEIKNLEEAIVFQAFTAALAERRAEAQEMQKEDVREDIRDSDKDSDRREFKDQDTSVRLQIIEFALGEEMVQKVVDRLDPEQRTIERELKENVEELTLQVERFINRCLYADAKRPEGSLISYNDRSRSPF